MSKNKIKNNSLILGEIKSLIEQNKHEIAINMNTTMSILYWQIGNRVNQEFLLNQRAEYGNSFSEKNLHRMMQFAEIFPDKEIVVSMIRQLSWSHILALIPIQDELKKIYRNV